MPARQLLESITESEALKRVNGLIKEIQRSPCEGIGKPEPLKRLSGYWLCRIKDERRIVYKVVDDQLFIAQLRYHYSYCDVAIVPRATLLHGIHQPAPTNRE